MPSQKATSLKALQTAIEVEDNGIITFQKFAQIGRAHV